MFCRSACATPARYPRPTGIGGPPMVAFVRAACAAALVLVLSVPAVAADKPFKRNDLADAAIKLEAQIKADAGPVTKAAPALRREADAAFQRNDFRAGMQILGQIDAVAASPRVCFQFSEDLPGRRTDFSPYVAVGGQDKPALSVQDRQLCVEGLKHGERYAITLRAGIPSVVRETLSKSAEFNVYVRDRKPLVRFTGKAYVLPRTGQRGIPVVSVNTT